MHTYTLDKYTVTVLLIAILIAAVLVAFGVSCAHRAVRKNACDPVAPPPKEIVVRPVIISYGATGYITAVVAKNGEPLHMSHLGEATVDHARIRYARVRAAMTRVAKPHVLHNEEEGTFSWKLFDPTPAPEGTLRAIEISDQCYSSAAAAIGNYEKLREVYMATSPEEVIYTPSLNL